MIKAGVMVRSVRTCAVCRKEWKQSDTKVKCHVICNNRYDDCQNVDLCTECSLCDEGHLLEVRYQRPWKYENV